MDATTDAAALRGCFASYRFASGDDPGSSLTAAVLAAAVPSVASDFKAEGGRPARDELFRPEPPTDPAWAFLNRSLSRSTMLSICRLTSERVPDRRPLMVLVP